MIRIVLLISILWAFYFNSYSQSNIRIDKNFDLNQDIYNLEHRLKKIINNDSFLSNMKGLEFYYILFMEYRDEYKREDFKNDSFVSKLYPTYYVQKRLFRNEKYLKAEVFISDSCGNLIATSNGRLVYSEQKYERPFSKVDQELLKMFIEKQIEIGFNLGLTNLNYLFALNKNEIYVLGESSEKLQKFSLIEFVECCWDKFVMFK
jgi:hypothetical protein